MFAGGVPEYFLRVTVRTVVVAKPISAGIFRVVNGGVIDIDMFDTFALFD